MLLKTVWQTILHKKVMVTCETLSGWFYSVTIDYVGDLYELGKAICKVEEWGDARVEYIKYNKTADAMEISCTMKSA